ncbi:alpha/beta hydrolase [Actinomyces glycerinitolerans]|uniref:Alpha/beta hydrolase fold n=1 Tax=Actinomyces glycerinitolerans TaxID=1892869 RepID=A0A1M4RXX0_9ACTO|nr:alpha/beta hydrolase [Actinomyces glycerinitolerans]SHE24802.1 alpha/beta hydrolase fold [Actinomyces glycerinitolerans]
MTTNKYCPTSSEYVPFDGFAGVVVHRPIDPKLLKPVTVVLMHSDDVYYGFIPGPELAKRGYTVVAGAVHHSEETLDQKIRDLGKAVEYARRTYPANPIVLLGHSGGASLISAYQAVAENSEDVFRDDSRIIKLAPVGELEPAQGVLLLDSNFGNGVMTLLSLEPGLVDASSGTEIDPRYDLFAPGNGWSAGGANYAPGFVREYLRAQAERNDELIDYALERLSLIEAGRGRFLDDEPMTIVGGNQFAPCNRLFPQDLHYLCHTEHPWPVIHSDGSITEQVVHSRRKVRSFPNPAANNGLSTKQTTVRNFLTNCAVRTQNFHYDSSHVYGIEWDSAYCNTPGNVQYISSPTLIMGNTGSYEFMAAEQIYVNMTADDKSMIFVEGAGHNFTPETSAEEFPGEFGDTTKNCFDYVASWLEERF